MSENPLVTIVIPTYNRVSFLADAIDSVISQTYASKQIIVVDDGSADDTAKLVRSYPEVEYIYQPHLGQATARNAGLEKAKGKYIASLDSDDTWNPFFLEKSIAFLEQEDLDFTFANWTQETRDGRKLNSFSTFPFFRSYLRGGASFWNVLEYPELRNLFIRHCPAPSSSLVLRRSSIVSGWNHALNIADDWGLLLDMILLKQCRAAFTTEMLWNKRSVDNNLFDGRDVIETVQLLDVEDCNLLAKRYHHYFSKQELRAFRKFEVQGLFSLSVYRLVTNGKLLESSQLLLKAFEMDPALLLKSTPQVVLRVVKYYVKRIVSR